MKIPIREVRERAERVIGAVGGLRDVRVVKLESDSHHPLLEGPFEVTPTLHISGRRGDMHTVEAEAEYGVQAVASADAESVAWRVRFRIVATWLHNGDPLLDDMDIQSFAIAIGSMVIHPYARETLQSVVGRMGYPPFTMDMLQSPIAENEDEELELVDASE